MSNVRQKLITGVFWSAIEKYSGLLVSIIVTMILARILSPEEYGIVAIATVLISFLQIFCTLGIGPAIIQRNDLTKINLNSIFTFSIVIGLVLSVSFFFCSWFIAEFYNTPSLVLICQLLSIQLFFAAANMVPNALMTKNMKFREIARRTLVIRSIFGSVAIIAAFNGLGLYSLLISPICTSISIFLWNRMYYKVNIDWNFDLEPIKRIFSYSSYQFLFSIVTYFSWNLDKLIVGKTLGQAPLGIYEKSYRLMQLPLSNVTFVITPVLQPILKDFQNELGEMSNKCNKLIKFVATLSFPIGALMWGLGDEIIILFYGNNWIQAIPVFKIISLSLPLQMILSLSTSLFLASNNTKMHFWLGIRNTATTVIGFIIAAYWFKSLESMAWSWTITLVINFFATYYFMYKFAFKKSYIEMIKQLIRPFSIFLLLVLLSLVLHHLRLSGIVLLDFICKLLISIGTTIGLVHAFSLYDIKELFCFIKKKLMKNENNE